MITPINGHLLVRRAERPTESAGGVLLPETSHTAEADEGFIVTGDYAGLPPGTMEGSRVVFKAYGACEVDIDGEKLLLLPAKNVIGVYAAGN